MDTNCCYAIQDKIWVNDPDSNEWEVFVVKEDNLAEFSVTSAFNIYIESDNKKERLNKWLRRRIKSIQFLRKTRLK